MSVETEILRIQRNIANAYAAVSDKGGEVPLQPTSENLPAAVRSIPLGGDTAYLVKAPVGTIVIWSGTADNIPAGWALCDGQDGRPDLRDKFVLGAGTNHAVGETGGEETHTLTAWEIPKHIHNINYSTTPGSGYGSIHGQGAEGEGVIPSLDTGGNRPHNNMPPYYALCYIIKVTADETDGEVYSTEETRIGTWIDGKPLYRKVFQAKTGTVITPSESNLIARVDGASIDRIVFMTGMFYPFNAETQMPVPNYQGVASSPHFMISVWANIKNGVLEIRERHLKETASDADIVVRIEYTKTTD